MKPNDKDFGLKWTRQQFPVMPAMWTTINKAQGQTIDIVGVNPQRPVFTHGQLYVAMSRVTDPANIVVAIPQTDIPAIPHADVVPLRSTNIVYTEILRMVDAE